MMKSLNQNNMANWEKLSKEFDKALNSMTKEDWDNWYKNVEQKRINQNKMEEFKWFKCKIEHIVNTELHYFEIPETPFNSFTMALAHFERQALSYPACGIIVKVEVTWVKNFN